MAIVTITAAELQKQFGRYAREAQREPVAVTHHGRESLVLMSSEEYRRLKSLEDRKAYYVWELPEDLVRILESAEVSGEGENFNHEVK